MSVASSDQPDEEKSIAHLTAYCIVAATVCLVAGMFVVGLADKYAAIRDFIE
jgi:hypothetical protein